MQPRSWAATASMRRTRDDRGISAAGDRKFVELGAIDRWAGQADGPEDAGAGAPGRRVEMRARSQGIEDAVNRVRQAGGSGPRRSARRIAGPIVAAPKRISTAAPAGD